jgi:hypothetical protein
MPAPTLSTPADRIGARDAATAYWYEHAERIDEGEITTSYERTTMARLHFVRESLATDFAAKMTDEGRIVISDEHGNTLTLEWDGRIDGFDYPTSGDDACDLGEEEAQREAEPEPETDGKVIDITPTWTSMIGMLACLIERGGESRRVAIAELTRLAQFADEANARNRPRCDGCGAECESEPFAGSTAGDESPRRFCARCK